MADYQLTQTGDEVQDILDNSQTGKYFYNQTVATWSSDATYSDYPYKGVITLTGVKGTDGVEVTFSNADATSGNYSPICNSVADGVEIWAKTQDNALVIPTIHITTGADVQLQGDDAYLPISGGNVTGSLSVAGSNVVTMGSVTNITPTFAGDVTDGSYTYCQKFGRVVCLGVNIQVTANRTAKSPLLTGLPAPEHGYGLNLVGDTAYIRAIINTTGQLRNDTTNVPAGWYNGSITYISAT